MSKKKKEEPEEVVQQIDLTELVNYVNYLGEKITEVGQSAQPPEIKFRMEVIDAEGQLANTKYFHTVVSNNMCADVSKSMKEFYFKKYGAIPEVLKIDFYAF